MKTISDWKPSHPPYVAVPVFKGNSTGKSISLCAELKSPDSAAFWTADFAVEPGTSYRIGAGAYVADPATVFNNVGVIVTWKSGFDFNTQLQREYLEPEINGSFSAEKMHRADQTVSVPGNAKRLLGLKNVRKDFLKTNIVAFSSILTAPENAKFAEIQLYAKWRKMKVTWGNIEVKKVKAPRQRLVKVVTTKVIPEHSPSTVAENVAQVNGLLERIGREVQNPDIILFPENMLDRCVRSPLPEKAESIPGPFTKLLSSWAVKLKCNIATTIHENDNGRFHNTAFVIDRKGRLAGKYRKVHLTLSELEAGLLPGSEFTVLNLDFGKVGFTTCWDNWFCESSRILRLKGAEMILFPLAGDTFDHLEHIWPARAIDNGFPLVVSVWQGEGRMAVPARIYDGSGAILAETRDRLGYAEATIDLNRRHRTFWLSVGPSLGEGRSLYVRERRPELYGELQQ